MKRPSKCSHRALKTTRPTGRRMRGFLQSSFGKRQTAKRPIWTPYKRLLGVESTSAPPLSRKERLPVAADTPPSAVATVPDPAQIESGAERRPQAERRKWIIAGAGLGLVGAVVLVWSLWPRGTPRLVESPVTSQPKTRRRSIATSPRASGR